jgi:hypothetical protein
MHERRSVNEFGVAPGPLCEKHQAELKARLALK